MAGQFGGLKEHGKILMVTHGDKAPNVRFNTMTGDLIWLSELWGNGQHVLLIFLRHLG